jgi:DNA polymerase-1
MKRLVWDVETNGLLNSATVLHCIAIQDVDTLQVSLYTDSLAMNSQGSIEDGVQRLRSADLIIGHNIINYDIPVVEKLTGVELPRNKVFDTLVATRLIWSNIGDIDMRRRKDYSLGNMFGNHSLAAWGVRLGGQLKMDYAPVMDPDQPVYDPKVKNPKKDPRWEGSIYTSMMGDYCVQDVRVNTELFLTIERKLKTLSYDLPLRIEHDASYVLSKQERNGFRFDIDKAHKLLAVLAARREYLYDSLLEVFGGWFIREGLVTPERNLNYKDPTKPSRTKGAPFNKVKWVEFNPSSRQHIIKVLKDRGWKPTEFTKTGEPKVDESILKKLKFPEAPLMAEWFLVQKRLGQLADGKQAWLNVVHGDGYIRGSVNPNGAVTGRATHSFPNVAQVPSCKAPYGPECRELFTVPEGWVLFGTDASGLELRCLGHYMYRFDGGAYIDVVLNGDIHVANQKAAGLATRNEAKTFIYAFLYGCGPELTGEQVGWSDEEYLKWKAKGQHRPVIRRLERQGKSWTRDKVCNILKGTQVQKKFMKGLPALKALIDYCKAQHKEHGYVIGLDGRKIFTRSEHAALNTLLQGAGAIICKQWIVEVERLALEAGYKHGPDGDFMYCAWVHDELQIACRTTEIAEDFGKIAQKAMRNVQKLFNFNCQLDTDYDIGPSWKDTH